jgi:small subunit ribosomal protein S4
MARRGPRLKVIRRLGTPLPGLTRKEPEAGEDAVRRPRGRRRAKSPYRLRLEEKQKVRFHYGITETQLRRYFERAARRPGVTGKALLALLERRLDNVVFRLGFAPTIPAARQLVGHGHVIVDGRRVDRPSQLIEEGQTITLSERARQMPDVARSVEQGPQVSLPRYLARDDDDPFSGRMVGSVRREDVPLAVDETAIVEFYAR